MRRSERLLHDLHRSVHGQPNTRAVRAMQSMETSAPSHISMQMMSRSSKIAVTSVQVYDWPIEKS